MTGRSLSLKYFLLQRVVCDGATSEDLVPEQEDQVEKTGTPRSWSDQEDRGGRGGGQSCH